ncbi:BCCT family transporter [Ammoniphilus sp. 3BR4]|uniref:BCCT family transporter n=1 Tax=Ammoniphilus sp. 3BR4 TaxID=3158265 RepID=UPI00346706D8
MKKLKHGVFWPPFLLLLVAVVLSFTNREVFITTTTKANNWVIANLGWLFSLSGLLMVIACVGVYFSPLGNVKIGGAKAKPLLSFKHWFGITLTTTIASGLTFWGILEPVYHVSAPPESLGITPNSPEAAIFAMSSMYLHWTITPYAIYCVPAIVFAFAYYNMRQPFSLNSTLIPVFGNKINGKWGQVVDAVCLLTLSLGMAGSIGQSLLNLAGGVNYLTDLPSNPYLWAIIAVVLTFIFIVSASTGLEKGIRILSDINMKVFYAIALFLFVAGPTTYLLNLGTESFGYYLTHFFEKSLFTGAAAKDPWPQWWTTFYWASWFAWAAITALFLGRIAYGYTVKAMIIVNFVLPALFGAIWMTLFGGTSIYMEMNGAGLADLMAKNGPEAVLYAVFGALPLAKIIIPFYLLIAFISFVTAADSNITAMGGISSTGISPKSPEPRIMVKVVWGITISFVAWVMISFAKIDGIKMLNNLGGVPALFLELVVLISLIKIAKSPEKYDKSEVNEDKDIELSKVG